MKTITLDYYGMRGTGRTVTEAKQDAGKKITEALSGEYEPRVYTWGGNTWVIWRSPHGIRSGRVNENGKISGVCMHCRSDSFEGVCRSMRLHLAQLGCDVMRDEIPAIIANDPQAIKDFTTWLGFQRAYRHARSQNLNDHEAHTFACNYAPGFAPTVLRPAQETVRELLAA